MPIRLNNTILVVIYGLINALFVYKYMGQLIGIVHLTALLYFCFIVFFASKLLILKQKREGEAFFQSNRWIYPVVIAVSSLFLTLLMKQFDPHNINVGRYPALYEWISRLLQGEFPYGSPTAPSGLPFLFIFATPFYVIGDLGYIQIFSFIVFASLLYLRHRQNTLNRLMIVALLVTAPVFLYEVVVRSELFSNMVITLCCLAAFEVWHRKPGFLMLILLGIAGGLLLSTRLIVLVIYLPFFGFFLFRQWQFLRFSVFALSAAISFLLTLLPFVLWDFQMFVDYGPFSIQTSYLPKWLLLIFTGICAYLGWAAKKLSSIYTWITITLFSVVLTSFILAIARFGWYSSVFQDRFDISYFCFTLPFLLISLRFPEEQEKPLKYVFV